MTLTTLEIFQRYSELTWYRKIFVKRYNSTIDEYESEWQDISEYMIKDSIKAINKQLPQDNYSFGSVIIDNCNFELCNVYGEMSDETNANSIFYNYQRHDSLIKVQEGYVDNVTDPNNRTNIEITVFNGLIDDKEAVTTMNYTEKYRAKDRLIVLERIKKSDLGAISATTINDFVYEAINRADITKYGINISSGTAYIDAGYNATCDFAQYENGETLLDIFQDLAKGNSIFYIDPDTDYFYFKTVTPTVAVQVTFEDILEKRIKIDGYMTGVDKVIETWYWEETNLSSASAISKYKTSELINIKGITNTAQRQNMLDYVRGLTETPKLHFDIIIPYFPIIKLLDRVTVKRQGVYPTDAFIIGVGRLGIDRLRRPVGSVALSATQQFYVRGIKHSKQTTIIHVQSV